MTGSTSCIDIRSMSRGRTPLLWEFSTKSVLFKTVWEYFQSPSRRIYKTNFKSNKCQKEMLWDGGGWANQTQHLSQELTGFKRWPWAWHWAWAAQKNLQSAGLDADLKHLSKMYLKMKQDNFVFPQNLSIEETKGTITLNIKLFLQTRYSTNYAWSLLQKICCMLKEYLRCFFYIRPLKKRFSRQHTLFTFNKWAEVFTVSLLVGKHPRDSD